jgi:hypothetical protein
MIEYARWSINELRARYELEPQLSDFFVEGVFDREVLSQIPFSKDQSLSFYEIDTVDISEDILNKYGLTKGNKQRVIALSRELASLPIDAKVKCLVDRDLDHWFGELAIVRTLKWSVYCSIEVHFLTEKCISDILVVAGRAKIKKLDSFIESLHIIIKQLYALRLADRELSLQLDWPPFRKHLAMKSDRIVLNTDSYTISLLTSNNQGKKRGAFERCCNKWITQLNCDIRLSARGHDYTELLAWAMNNLGGKKELASSVAIERLFVLLAASVNTLSKELQ